MHNLLHDNTANTLAIAAASLIPMMAMVGGGIDASRYYMAAADHRHHRDQRCSRNRERVGGVVVQQIVQERRSSLHFSPHRFGALPCCPLKEARRHSRCSLCP
ncbi:MAG: hypothetical protein H2049_09405 [Porphyrobacter sp.]|nr:hypothetical protein [Porphyrobacter sp.]